MISQRTDDDGVWWWPSNDTKCWDGLHRWIDVPDGVMEYVPEKNVMVQAGGNSGLYVKKYAKKFKTVYTFEPFPELFECLVRNVNEPNVIKIQACVGNSHTLVNMEEHFEGDAGGGHVGTSRGIVPTFLIDDLNLPECNLIHLDIEGYEPFALEGARETILRCKPIIAIENCEKWLNRYGKGLGDIEDILVGCGYRYIGSVKGDRVYSCT
jgi:FkbM family methyltransferase